MLYVSYAQGFKGGGFDPRGNATIAPDTDHNGVRSYREILDFFLFDPELVSSYELGWKGSFADGAVNLVLTGFFADYKNVQIPGNVGVDTNGDGIFVLRRCHDERREGPLRRRRGRGLDRFAADFAGDGSALTLNASVGYIEPEYERYLVSGVDVSNFRTFQNTPQWTASSTLGARLHILAGR